MARELPTFGGLWYNDHDQVVVGLTDVADLNAAIPLIIPHLGSHRPTGGFVAQQVEYPFLQLARYRTALRGHLFAIPCVVTLSVKESLNGVRVGTANAAAEAAVNAVLQDLGIPQEAVVTTQMPYPVAQSHTLMDTAVLVQGGWEITAPSICTLGFPARRVATSEEVFITNSHCTATPFRSDSGMVFQAGRVWGTEIVDPPTWNCWAMGWEDDCRNSDAAIIRASTTIDLGRIARPIGSTGCDDCSGPLEIDHNNPTVPITGRNDNVFENETLHKVGRSTGWTHGAVEDTCGDSWLNEEWVILCADRVDYSSDGGDSGSPVFYLKADGTAELRGLHFGYIAYPYSDGLMSDLRQIELDLGELVVFDPGPPSVQIAGPDHVPPWVVCTWTALVSGGIKPFDYVWSGVLSGTAADVSGSVSSSGWLSVHVTDGYDRSTSNMMYITVDSSAPVPPGCSE